MLARGSCSKIAGNHGGRALALGATKIMDRAGFVRAAAAAAASAASALVANFGARASPAAEVSGVPN